MIRYSVEASDDVQRHHDWLLEYSVKAAEAFDAELLTAERLIARNPESFRLLSDGMTRRFSFRLSRTSYLLDYRLSEGVISILRVWHGRQDRAE